MVDLTFIILDLEEEDEGATMSPLETWSLGGTKIPGVHSQCTPINLDENMENVEELDGTSAQPKTSWQPKPKMRPTLLLVLQSWNLGWLHPKNLISLPGKGVMAN